jgi:hypothetical protein
MKQAGGPRRIGRLIAAAVLALAAGRAQAQLLGGGRLLQLPALPAGRLLTDVTQDLGKDTQDLTKDLRRDLDPEQLLDLRRTRLDQFVRAHRAEVERDAHGQPVVRGEVLALAPAPATLEAAERAGFSVLRRETLEPLDVEVVVLGVPRGMTARDAIRRLQAIDPEGGFDYDHIYFPSGRTQGAASAGPAGEAPHGGAQARAGLIDTGVDVRHPALTGARIEQRGFAPGAPAPAAHGTATASLIVGEAGGFRGAAPGVGLLVADVYGRAGAGGSAESVARALAWMAGERVPVVNISLVGPDNRLLAAAIRAASARGEVIVAAIGNDGPAAPPMYPASYPEVISVSAVDGRGRPLLEAGRAVHVDFCAPGADMAAASLGGGFAVVRGTSFAAPVVAGLLAERTSGGGAEAAPAARDALARLAAPPAGDRKACGRGLVGTDVRTDPKRVGARRPLEP